MDNSFADTKEELATSTILYHPQMEARTTLSVDASDSALGGVLEQYIQDEWRPLFFNSLEFFSTKLRPPEQKYSTFVRELLVVHFGRRHFRYFLEGRDFTIYTDHIPLTFALSKVSEPCSACQQR